VKLPDLIERRAPEPWEAGGKIPWDEPGFSARMLREHLTQDHDRASRRAERIDRQVDWLHRALLGTRPGRVLDLGCGPGLYAERLARLGHSCVGIDFSPASIAHARARAESQGLDCEYQLEDLCGAHFGNGFDLALLIFGELDTFPAEQAGALLTKARRALAPGGALVLEVHEEAWVRERARRPPIWFTERRGLFSDEPYLCLLECAWNEAQRVSTERYLILDAATAEVSIFLSSLRACSDREHEALLRAAGFDAIERRESLEEPDASQTEGLYVLVARAG
jgi:SAM-dependent methyltransferase